MAPDKYAGRHGAFVDAILGAGGHNGDEAVDAIQTSWTPKAETLDQYTYDYLGYHLIEAGRRRQFAMLLLNMDWLVLQMSHVGFSALWNDFERFRMCNSEDVSEFQGVLAAIQTVLKDSQPYLVKSYHLPLYLRARESQISSSLDTDNWTAHDHLHEFLQTRSYVEGCPWILHRYTGLAGTCIHWRKPHAVQITDGLAVGHRVL